MGMLLDVRVHSANIQDRDGGRSLLDSALNPSPEPTDSTPIIEPPSAPLATITPTPGVDTPGSSLPDGQVASPSTDAAPPPTEIPGSSQPGEKPEPPVQARGAAIGASSQVAQLRRLPTLTKMWADGAYAGFLEKYALIKYGIDLEIVRRSDERAAKMWVAPGDSPTPRENGFKLLPHRWIVERTLGWIGRNRRLSTFKQGLRATN